MIDSSIVRRLASACARGWRQQALVNELLVAPVTRAQFIVPGSMQVSSVYGQTRLPSKSFRNLRVRLSAVGFVFATTRLNHEEALISMTFPEQKGTTTK